MKILQRSKTNLLLGISLVCVFFSCLASASPVITDIVSDSRKNLYNGVEITRYMNQEFELSFSSSANNGEPKYLRFYTYSDVGCTHRLQAKNISERYFSAIPADGFLEYRYNMRAALDQAEILGEVYSIEIYDKDDHVLHTLKEGMPEFVVSLKQEGDHYFIELKNTKPAKSYNFLKIQSVSGDKYLEVLSSHHDVRVNPGEKHTIELRLIDDVGSDPRNIFEQDIVIKYVAGRENIEARVRLKINNDAVACNGKIEKEYIKEKEIVYDTVPDFTTTHGLEMTSENSGKYKLIIDNTTGHKIKIGSVSFDIYLQSKCASLNGSQRDVVIDSGEAHEFVFEVKEKADGVKKCKEYVTINYTVYENGVEINKKAIIPISITRDHQANNGHWYSWNNYGWMIATGVAVVAAVVVYAVYPGEGGFIFTGMETAYGTGLRYATFTDRHGGHFVAF